MSPNIGSITLNLRKLAIMEGISGEMLHQLRVEIDQPAELLFVDHLLLKLRTAVWTENLPPEQVQTEHTYSFSIPATWWQHAKQQHYNTWWMGWIARRRPPRMRERTITGTFVVHLHRFRVYPDAPAVPASYGQHVLQHEVTSDVRWMTGEEREPHAYLHQPPTSNTRITGDGPT